jgi:hypothetical protein
MAILCKMYNTNNWYSVWWRVPVIDSLFYELHDYYCKEKTMKSKSFLVTVYYNDPDNNFILDKNELTDDYDYNLCITKVISTHLQSVNSDDVEIVDVASTHDPKRIKTIAKRMERNKNA